MAIAYRSQASLPNATRTTTQVNMPAGVQAGDVVLVFCATGASAEVAITPPASLSGTPVANRSYSDTSPPWTVNMRIYRYTVLGSGNPTSFAFTHASAASEALAIAFSGVDTTNPIDATPTTNSGLSTTATLLGLTTTIPAAWLVAWRGSWDGNAITPPAGWTERLDQPVTWVAHQEWAAAGPTGDFSIPSGNGGAYPYGAILIPLRPASGGAGASPADTVGVADTTAGVASRPRTQTDPLGLTDAAQTAVAAVRSAADTVGLTDSLQVSSGASVTRSDTLGVTDATTLVRAVTLADTVGATDAARATVGAAVTDDDPLGVTDNVTAALSIARAVGDQVGLTDSVDADLTSPGSADLVDPLGVTDLLATTAQILRAAGDSIGITDLVSAGFGRSSSPGDQVGISDSVTAQTGAAPGLADGLGISDSAVAVLQRVVIIGDPVGTRDAVHATNPDIPPLPTEGVSLIANVTQRGLTPTGETRDLEVSS